MPPASRCAGGTTAGVENMAIRKTKRGYLADWRIVEAIIYWSMSGLTLTGRPNREKLFERMEAEISMLMDIRRFLKDARCQDQEKFFSGIRPEVDALKVAMLALSRKVYDESYLFLDIDGNPVPEFTSYDNPSSDAD